MSEQDVVSEANILMAPVDFQSEAYRKRLRRRHAAATRLRVYGAVAIGMALAMLILLLGRIVTQGTSAFFQTQLRLEIFLDPKVIDPAGKRDPDTLAGANYRALIGQALEAQFSEVEGPPARRELLALVSYGARDVLEAMVLAHPEWIGSRQQVWLPASDDVDQLVKGAIPRDVPESQRRVSDQQLAWIDQLKADGALEQKFNADFFTQANSREPELAGVWGGIVGSFYTMLVTLALAFPVAVATSVYLEEFAPKNTWTDIIEVNINNLIAVPSIVFGLLGLAIFLNFFNLPRSSPLVGGIVLALMTMPFIIIASRSALKAVPPSVREGALAVGASRMQVVCYHVLPLAIPGILTGTIIGMSQALGETAPLLLIGMVAFVVGIPDGITEPASVLPVQIYLWSTSPERGFVEKTAAAIMVLLAFLVLMNATAIYLRHRLERRW